ncbi:hypothetical protein, partial [Clostridioides difficile]|uniref:hypothetical protein n=1 Tax=Clostridioides difficile TaxID=1496 RepID=UPI000BD46CAC
AAGARKRQREEQRDQQEEKKENEPERKQKERQQRDRRQRKLNKLLETAERAGADRRKKNATRTAENGSLRAEIDRVRETLTQKINELSERLKGVYDCFRTAVKAIGMLKYDKKDGYKVEGLTTKPDRLIDCIVEYGAKWAREEGFPDHAEDMEKHIGIS